MKQLLSPYILFSLLGGALLVGNSCKKKEVAPLMGATDSTEILGCTDPNAYNYNPEATATNNNCTFIKTTMYEVSYHAEFNPSGSSWDSFVNKKADIIFRFREQGATSWMFESAVVNNHTHTAAVQWPATAASVLKNKTYEWELVDDETVGSAEFMAGGNFKPKDLTTSNNEIILTYSDANGLKTQVKIYYFIQ